MLDFLPELDRNEFSHKYLEGLLIVLCLLGLSDTKVARIVYCVQIPMPVGILKISVYKGFVCILVLVHENKFK